MLQPSQQETTTPRAGGSRGCPAGCAGVPAVRYDLARHRVARCPACGVYVLTPGQQPGAQFLLDRSQFDGALHALRAANYRRILQRLGRLRPLSGSRVLDVGCSSGWFLELAKQAGCECFGLEPDEYFYRRIASGPFPLAHLVRGFFPQDLPAEWGAFDVVTFHDVFEHLPDPLQVLAAVRARLVPGGCLVLSLPAADGFVFRMAVLLRRLGIPGPLARVFQVNYPFPHLYYFTRASLMVLAQRAGFEPVLLERLQSFSMRGALHRARMDAAQDIASVLKNYASAGALLVFALLEPWLPADSLLAILRPTAP
jgi:SAM-dependent methyltransferase